MRVWVYAALALAALLYWGAALHFLLNGSGWVALIVWAVIFGLAVQLVTWLLGFLTPREFRGGRRADPRP